MQGQFDVQEALILWMAEAARRWSFRTCESAINTFCRDFQRPRRRGPMAVEAFWAVVYEEDCSRGTMCRKSNLTLREHWQKSVRCQIDEAKAAVA